MALLDIRFIPQTHAIGGLSGIIHSIVSAVLAWNDARVTRKALSALSDHELEDIGISRGDIDSVY